MDIYYELLRKKLIDANGRAAASPVIHLGEKTIWNLHLRSGGSAADLSGVVSWRAAIDKDWSSSTDPMCRTVSGIDVSRAADGILGIPINANTVQFAAAVNGKRSVNAVFELRGYDSNGDVVLVIQITVQAVGAIDPAGVSDLDPVPDGMASEAWVRSFLESKADTTDFTALAGRVSAAETALTGKAAAADAVQPGSVIAFAGDAAQIPAGYLLCNGAAVSREDYADLFAAIGTIYGSGDGETTFNLPDFRGKFLRGYLDGTSAAMGTAQGDAIRNLTAGSSMFLSGATGAFSDYGTGMLRLSSTSWVEALSKGETRIFSMSFSLDASREVPTAAENRPGNYAVNFIIKY